MDNKCINCNTIVGSNAKFCTNCGKPLPKTKKCIQCGAFIKEEALFCTNCGTKQSVKEEKPKVEEVQSKNEVKTENPTPKKEETLVVTETSKVEEKKTVSEPKVEEKVFTPKKGETPVVTETPKAEEKETVSEPKVEEKESTTKNQSKNEQPVQEAPVKKKATRKKKNEWIPIVITIALICLWNVVKQRKSEPKEEKIEYTTNSNNELNNNVFKSELDIRNYLCEHVFIDGDGYRISFVNKANNLAMNGRMMTSSLTINKYNGNQAELYFQGDYGKSRFHLVLNDERGIITDMSDNTSYTSYTLEEASNMPLHNVNNDIESNSMSLEEFYNNYVFGNKDFSNIAQTTCTPRLLQQLKDAYEYECESGDCYAMWLFRSGNQDGISDESGVRSVTNEGDGWFKVSYIDMGIEGATYIHLIQYGEVQLIDEIRRAN